VPPCSFRRGSALTALHTEHPADNPNNLFLTSSAHLHERIGLLDSTDKLPSAHASAWPTPRGGTPIAITAADLNRDGEQHAEGGTTMPPRATTAPGVAASRSDEVRRSDVITRSAQATTADGCALVCVCLCLFVCVALRCSRVRSTLDSSKHRRAALACCGLVHARPNQLRVCYGESSAFVIRFDHKRRLILLNSHSTLTTVPLTTAPLIHRCASCS
jgi:hypothetical protein